MTFGYARLKSTADRLIASAGQAATLRRPTSTGTAFNPTPGAPVDYAVRVVVEAYRIREVDGTRIRADDLKVLMAKGSLAVEPLTTDRLLIGGVEHAIMDVRPTSPGGAVVMFEIQARR